MVLQDYSLWGVVRLLFRGVVGLKFMGVVRLLFRGVVRSQSEEIVGLRCVNNMYCGSTTPR